MNQLQMPITFLSAPKDLQKIVEESYDKGQHLYFVVSKELNMVKIGIAQEPHYRLKALQIANPTQLELIYVVPFGGFALEQRLHEQFNDLRTRGEWFKFGAPIQEFIDKVKELAEEVGIQWNLATHQIQT